MPITQAPSDIVNQQMRQAILAKYGIAGGGGDGAPFPQAQVANAFASVTSATPAERLAESQMVQQAGQPVGTGPAGDMTPQRQNVVDQAQAGYVGSIMQGNIDLSKIREQHKGRMEEIQLQESLLRGRMRAGDGKPLEKYLLKFRRFQEEWAKNPTKEYSDAQRKELGRMWEMELSDRDRVLAHTLKARPHEYSAERDAADQANLDLVLANTKVAGARAKKYLDGGGAGKLSEVGREVLDRLSQLERRRTEIRLELSKAIQVGDKDMEQGLRNDVNEYTAQIAKLQPDADRYLGGGQQQLPSGVGGSPAPAQPGAQPAGKRLLKVNRADGVGMLPDGTIVPLEQAKSLGYGW